MRTGAFRCLIAVAVPAVILFISGLEAPDPGHLQNYPQLLRADPVLVEQIRPHLCRPWSEVGSPGGPLVEILEEGGGDAPFALLRAMMDRHAELNSTTRHTFYMKFRTIPDSPFTPMIAEPMMAWIAGRRDPSLNTVLLRMLVDPELHFSVRERLPERALAALVWPGNRGALPGLVSAALDPNESPGLRCYILLRLPEIGEPLPEDLHALLFRPFHHLDYLTACALAETGNLEAPSLLLEALHWAESHDPDHALPHLTRVIRKVVAGKGGTLSDGPELLEAGFRRWMMSHPTALQTGFESRLRASPPGGEEPIELARRSLLAFGAPETSFNLCVSRLRRLGLGIASEIGEDRDPERVIEILCRRLFAENRRFSPATDSNLDENSLERALTGGRSACLGLSTLSLAVAEQLDLPLFGVTSPGHVFVRWDDGVTRRNIETTDQGLQFENEFYLDYDPLQRIGEESISSGVYLRNLTPDQFLSVVWADRSNEHLRRGDLGAAEAAANRALELHPSHVLALRNRAAALYLGGPDRDEEALTDLRTALRLNPANSLLNHIVALYLYDMERFKEALEYAKRALELAPRDPDAVLLNADCLLRLGRYEEAMPVIIRGRFTPDSRYHPYAEVLDLRARIFAGDETWRDSIGGFQNSPYEGNSLLLAADAFLTAAPGHIPDPAAATRLLDRAEEIRHFESFSDPTFRAGLEPQRDLWLLRARVALLEGDVKGAEEAIVRAAGRGGWGRETKRLLRRIKAAGAESGK